MTPAEFIAKRRDDWNELDRLTADLEYRPGQKNKGELVLRFGQLYRAVCTDLSLAGALRLPYSVISRLDRMVSRAHGVLYSRRKIEPQRFLKYLLTTIPSSMRKDRLVVFCISLFYAVFSLAAITSYIAPSFAEQVVGRATLHDFQEMHQQSQHDHSAGDVAAGSGFYILNNVSINLTCFSLGILGGIGSLYIMIMNATYLGAVIGYLLNTPAAAGILAWIPVHGPLELTAIGVSAGAGMRIGLAFVLAKNRPRLTALQEGAAEAVPVIAGAAIFTFIAAFLEAFFGPAKLSVWIKMLAGGLTFILMALYISGIMGKPTERS